LLNNEENKNFDVGKRSVTHVVSVKKFRVKPFEKGLQGFGGGASKRGGEYNENKK
jgi:hypothetical protein